MHTFFRNNSSTYLILFKWRLRKISREITRYVSFIPFFVFGFWSLLATKIWKYYVIFVYILQGKMEKNGKKITQLKWPKYQKIKIWDERNNSPSELISSHRLWLFKMIFTVLLSLTYLCTLTRDYIDFNLTFGWNLLQ